MSINIIPQHIRIIELSPHQGSMHILCRSEYILSRFWSWQRYSGSLCNKKSIFFCI